MSDSFVKVYKKEGVLRLLEYYGLPEIISDQDDPQLWAQVFAQHWYAPWEPEIQPTTLRFGIHQLILQDDTDTLVARSGMEEIEVWCFQRVDSHHLKPITCPTAPSMSFMTMIVGGNVSALGNSQLSFVYNFLDISRPSLHQKKALIHKGFSSPPNAGAGETRFWLKNDGSWYESSEIFSHWLS